MERQMTTFPDVTIHTDRLVLRPYEEADIPELAEMMADDLITAWTSAPTPYGRAEAHDWITRQAPGERAEGRGIVFAICEHLTHRLVGSVALMQTAWPVRATEVGYAVAPWARGEGYAGEAVQGLARWLFGDQKFERLELRTAAGNAASQQVALKLGCVSEGVLRNAGIVRSRTEDGGWAEIRTDLIVWSLLPEDLDDAPEA
jgi:RimJ/RimL family protein N-acetyltransferase